MKKIITSLYCLFSLMCVAAQSFKELGNQIYSDDNNAINGLYQVCCYDGYIFNIGENATGSGNYPHIARYNMNGGMRLEQLMAVHQNTRGSIPQKIKVINQQLYVSVMSGDTATGLAWATIYQV